MPSFVFVCGAGHETVTWFRDAHERPRTSRCLTPRCGRRATYSLTATHRGGMQVIGDIPAHFNVSLGEAVRSRRHLAQLQRQHGCQDYEPSPKAREWIDFTREKTLAGRR